MARRQCESRPERGRSGGLLGGQRHDGPVRQQRQPLKQHVRGSSAGCRSAVRLSICIPRLGDVQLHRIREWLRRLPPHRIRPSTRLHGLGQPVLRNKRKSSFDSIGRLVEPDREPDPSARTDRAPPVAISFDNAGTSSGFYLRDFDVHAPASYTGEVVESDTHYLIGTLSFWGPSVERGGINLIRTPGGELLTYGATWDPSNVPSDSIYFRTFDVPENPQVLFGVMLVACYAISRLQEGAYQRFRDSYPAEYRPAVYRAKWLHRAGKAGIGVLILFYFVPTALWVIGIRT